MLSEATMPTTTATGATTLATVCNYVVRSLGLRRPTTTTTYDAGGDGAVADAVVGAVPWVVGQTARGLGTNISGQGMAADDDVHGLRNLARIRPTSIPERHCLTFS